jgi:putative DNA primase/helicase
MSEHHEYEGLCDRILEEAGKPAGNADEEMVTALAELSELAYQRRRIEEAAKLGITVKALDKVVAKKRIELEADHIPMLYPHWTVEPWEEPVDGSILLEMLVKKIRRHVVMSRDQANAVALWVILTWVHDRTAVHSPLLLVTSAEANSGKSTLIGIIGFLARRALLSVTITGPALFRSIEKWQPTFAIDEADTVLVNNDDLKEVINSGWTRGQTAIRCDPETNEPRPYSTFCPKAIGMKGRKLPDTTLSRAIIIEMKRKRPDEIADDFDHIDDAESAGLRRQLLRWADDHAAVLAKAKPEIPDGFHNRVRANWKLLLAIAEQVGGDWKQQAWQAAGAIERVKSTFESSIGVTLLGSIRTMFEPGVECLLSRDMITNLTADPEQPWIEYRHGKPITQKQLAGLLGQYGIISNTIHPPGLADGKGYKRHQFEEAWGRYLTPSDGFPPFETSIRPNADEAGTSSDFLSVRKDVSDGSENPNLSHSHAGLDAWTDRKPGNGAKGCIDHDIEPPDDPPELAAESPPTATRESEPPLPGHRTEPTTVRAQVVPASNGHSSDDPWADYPDIPPSCDRRPKPVRERLGPPAISAGDDDDLGDVEM